LLSFPSLFSPLDCASRFSETWICMHCTIPCSFVLVPIKFYFLVNHVVRDQEQFVSKISFLQKLWHCYYIGTKNGVFWNWTKKKFVLLLCVHKYVSFPTPLVFDGCEWLGDVLRIKFEFLHYDWLLIFPVAYDDWLIVFAWYCVLFRYLSCSNVSVKAFG